MGEGDVGGGGVVGGAEGGGGGFGEILDSVSEQASEFKRIPQSLARFALSSFCSIKDCGWHFALDEVPSGFRK